MDIYDEPTDALFPVFTKKDSILSALKRGEKGQSSNPGRGLVLSLSFPFDLLRRRYLEGIMKNLEKVNFQTQNIETLPDLKTCG